MRFNVPQVGDKRIVHDNFLLFPMTIGRELRWLERASWEEVLKADWRGVGHWEPVRWVD